MVAVVTGVASVFVASWTLTRRAQLVCDSSDSLTDEIKYLDNVFNKNNYNRDFIRHNTYRNSEPNATNTDATPVCTFGSPLCVNSEMAREIEWNETKIRFFAVESTQNDQNRERLPFVRKTR